MTDTNDLTVWRMDTTNGYLQVWRKNGTNYALQIVQDEVGGHDIQWPAHESEMAEVRFRLAELEYAVNRLNTALGCVSALVSLALFGIVILTVISPKGNRP